MFDQQMLDSLAKASTKLHREKRRAYSAAQSHIVNYSRDLMVDKMAELDEVVENPTKQLIKPSPPIFVHFLQICAWFNFLQNLVELLWAHPHHLFEPTCIVHF